MIASPQLEIAIEFLAAGINVMPLELDGSKSPKQSKWKHLQSEMMTAKEAESCWRTPAGIGIIAGTISGGLEILDFDEWRVFEPFKSILNPSLMSILPVVETGSGGFHVFYRCSEIAGNTKLATLETPLETASNRLRKTPQAIYPILTNEYGGDAGKYVRIETRGEGGYVVGCGSPARVHPSGQPYVQIAGPVLPAIPTITPDERRELWRVAKLFDCSGAIPQSVAKKIKEIKQQQWKANRPAANDGTVKPWDDFDARASIAPILLSLGWTQFGERGWGRPRNDGKPVHVNANINIANSGSEVLTVFTTSIDGLDAGKSHGAFNVLKQLVYAGDGSAATKAVAAQGYGRVDNSDVDLSGIERQSTAARKVSA